jgi:hypothetical protein
MVKQEAAGSEFSADSDAIQYARRVMQGTELQRLRVDLMDLVEQKIAAAYEFNRSVLCADCGQQIPARLQCVNGNCERLP